MLTWVSSGLGKTSDFPSVFLQLLVDKIDDEYFWHFLKNIIDQLL